MLTPQSRNRLVLSSPHYPYEYPANLECVWKLIAPKGYAIKLSFHDFDIEWDQNCEYDFLDILLLNMHGETMRYKSITHIYDEFLPEHLHSYGTQSVLTVRSTCVALISLVWPLRMRTPRTRLSWDSTPMVAIQEKGFYLPMSFKACYRHSDPRLWCDCMLTKVVICTSWIVAFSLYIESKSIYSFWSHSQCLIEHLPLSMLKPAWVSLAHKK